jgi:hypothetical protein
MTEFAAGLAIGLAFGVIVIGFLAVAAYERGYDEAIGKRKQWRTELVARRVAAQRTLAAAVPARKAS